MATKLNEASSKADILSEMVELATTSIRHSTEFRRSRDEDVAKLQEELSGERASCIEEVARLERELNKEKVLREEAWKTLEDERRVHKENLFSEKAAFDTVLKEEKRMRVAAETRIQALGDELKTARSELIKTEADLNGARVRICTTVADFKKSPICESYIELRRQ